MALVNIKDGTVTRVNRTGYGVRVTESNEYQGKTYKKHWTVWFKEAHGLAEGDVVSVSGFYDDKVGEPFTGDDGLEHRAVERSINNPRLLTSAPNEAGAANWAPVNPDAPF